MQFAKRYYLGEDITLIRFYTGLSEKRVYLTLNDLVTQCINGKVLITDVGYDTFPLTVTREVFHGDRAIEFIGDWMFSAENSHYLTGFNRLSPESLSDTFDVALDYTWEIIEYRIVKTRAYDAIDIRYARDFLKVHESITYPLIRRMDKQFIAH